jgi:hypothetical protein
VEHTWHLLCWKQYPAADWTLPKLRYTLFAGLEDAPHDRHKVVSQPDFQSQADTYMLTSADLAFTDTDRAGAGALLLTLYEQALDTKRFTRLCILNLRVSGNEALL